MTGLFTRWVGLIGPAAFITLFLLIAVAADPERGAFTVSPAVATATAPVSDPTPRTEVEPNWTDQWSTFAAVASAIVAFVGLLVVYFGGRAAYRQLRLVETSTSLSALSILATRWDSEQLIQARRFVNGFQDSARLAEAIKKADEDNAEDYYRIASLLGFFEELGYLCKSSVKDATILNYVRAVFRQSVLDYYELLEKYIVAERDDEPRMAENFTALYQALRKR